MLERDSKEITTLYVFCWPIRIGIRKLEAACPTRMWEHLGSDGLLYLYRPPCEGGKEGRCSTSRSWTKRGHLCKKRVVWFWDSPETSGRWVFKSTLVRTQLPDPWQMPTSPNPNFMVLHEVHYNYYSWLTTTTKFLRERQLDNIYFFTGIDGVYYNRQTARIK